MNFGGIGFNFVGKDKGLDKALATVSQGFGRMVGSAVSAVSGLASAGQHLTTAYEAVLVTNRKTSKQMMYMMGVSKKQTKQFMSAAQSISDSFGIGIDTATTAVVEFSRAQDKFAKLGIKSAAQLAKVQEVTGLSATDLRETMTKLDTSLGIKTPEAVQKLMGSMISFGKAGMNMQESFNLLNTTVDQLRTRAGMAGKTLSEMDLAKLGAQNAAAAVGFKSLGFSAEEAAALSSKTSELQIQGQGEFQKMLAGTGSDIGEFVKRMAILTGNVESSFDIMKGGPQDVLGYLGDMVKGARANGRNMADVTNFMAGQLSNVFGEDQANKIVSSLSMASDETIDSLKNATKDTETLGEAADYYLDARNRMEKVTLSFEKNLTRIINTGKDADEWADMMINNFNKMGDLLVGKAKEGGILGNLVTGFADFYRVGVSAFLPEKWQGVSLVAPMILGELGPVLGLLKDGAGLAFGFGEAVIGLGSALMQATIPLLLNPIGLAIGGFGGLLYACKTDGDSFLDWLKALGGFLKSVANTIIHPIDNMKSVVGSFLETFASFTGAQAGSPVMALAKEWQKGGAENRVIAAQEEAATQAALRSSGFTPDAYQKALAVAPTSEAKKRQEGGNTPSSIRDPALLAATNYPAWAGGLQETMDNIFEFLKGAAGDIKNRASASIARPALAGRSPSTGSGPAGLDVLISGP